MRIRIIRAETGSKFPIGPREPVTFRLASDVSRPAHTGGHISLRICAELSEQDADVSMSLRPIRDEVKVASDLRLLCIGRIPGGAEPSLAFRADPFRALMRKVKRFVVMESKYQAGVVWNIERGDPIE